MRTKAAGSDGKRSKDFYFEKQKATSKDKVGEVKPEIFNAALIYLESRFIMRKGLRDCNSKVKHHPSFKRFSRTPAFIVPSKLLLPY